MPDQEIPEVRISVVLTGSVMAVRGFLGGQAFKEIQDVPLEAFFFVVDENRGGNVHRGDQNETLLDPRIPNNVVDATGEVDELHAMRGLKPEIFGMRFHCGSKEEGEGSQRGGRMGSHTAKCGKGNRRPGQVIEGWIAQEDRAE